MYVSLLSKVSSAIFQIYEIIFILFYMEILTANFSPQVLQFSTCR